MIRKKLLSSGSSHTWLRLAVVLSIAAIAVLAKNIGNEEEEQQQEEAAVTQIIGKVRQREERRLLLTN